MKPTRPRRADILPPAHAATDHTAIHGPTMRTFLGLAPRAASTGWAVIRVGPAPRRPGARYVQHGVIHNPDPKSYSSHPQAIMTDLIDAYAPDLVVLCSANFLRLVTPDYPRPGPTAVASPEAAVHEVARERDIPVAAYAPSAVAAHLLARAGPGTPNPPATPGYASPDPALIAAALLGLPVVPRPPEAALALSAALTAALTAVLPGAPAEAPHPKKPEPERGSP